MKFDAISLISALINLYIFTVGICIGSFANVLIYRIPLQMNFTSDRSICPKCGNRLKVRHLVPVFSYVFLGGKCAFCKERISPRYPLVELAGGLAVLLCYRIYGPTVEGLLVFVFAILALVISLIDIDHMIIPNSLVAALAALGILFYLVGDIGLVNRIVAVFVLSVPMYILCRFIPNAFGGGDIKLIAVCGLILGLPNILLAGFLSIMFGGVYAVRILLNRGSDRAAHMPFGQCICIGAVLSYMFGSEILSWYISLL